MTIIEEKPKKKKKKNYGKIFEKNFFDSVPKDLLFKREKDTVMRFKGDKNGFDAFIFTGQKLIFLELKTHLNGFIPKGALSEYQIEYLNKYSCYPNCITGFIFNFRDQEGNPTYFIPANIVYKAIYEDNLSGFNVFFCECNGIPIHSTIKRVHHKYDIEGLLQKLKEEFL